SRKNIQFIQGRVIGLDPIQRKIMLEEQQYTHQLEYDYLVYALGSETDRKTVPGVAEYAYTLAARGPLSAAALRETLPSIEARGGQVVVAGVGAEGVETAEEEEGAYPLIKVGMETAETWTTHGPHERRYRDDHGRAWRRLLECDPSRQDAHTTQLCLHRPGHRFRTTQRDRLQQLS